ncbi:hypothetical protein HNQ50_000395 [Silvimonas terrae]|uniref:DUF4124 domain-containing protein n=1 Tax=Silvimonas terrae TaxID=300266 RepID=A0A840R8N2_9NEIS|nr:hypothetical protein [Silvimonas terrae]MBB5189685.1 hypothetical protein [Silvimonas terrae]
MRPLLLCLSLVCAAVAHADQRYSWDCRDSQHKPPPGKTIAALLAPGQRHFILGEDGPTRQLIGVKQAGVCSTATLIVGGTRYDCVPARPVDGQGRPGALVKRADCDAAGQ